MALKKSAIYARLWQSCDALRGGMDASQYKDYVLALLFVKYISDKYTGEYAEITIPPGASFADMVALKGSSDLGDQLNKKIFEPIASENGLPKFANFNDTAKLGSGAEMVHRLDKLIGIFENLNFSRNRADGDDILGDAYEYLMRHFATESGKSKGQFYTPAEVSRIMASIIGIAQAEATARTTVYDPTCGSGSLLLKVGEAAPTKVALYGQEKDVATQGLARMNMVLHGYATAEIEGGNTLTTPLFKNGEALQTFDYVVANPPFSDKDWSTGLIPDNDAYGRFTLGIPPEKNGDYAYLLHILASLKPTGKGACILPHGVLFRGNAEADIRRALLQRGYIKGIIGLPANLFYGTGIPACIVVLDKEQAASRRGIFMVDASKGFIKDGPKNRLRARDIHKIVDVFLKQRDVPGFARMVSHADIEANGCNLNLPRYIDSQEAEDRQDIQGHLRGGIPVADVDALAEYWRVCPGLRDTLFAPMTEGRPGYVRLAVDSAQIRTTVREHKEFAGFMRRMARHFVAWREKQRPRFAAFAQGQSPKELGTRTANDLLAHYAGQPLMDNYTAYQCFMDLWDAAMQDDCYSISQSGWQAEIVRVVEVVKSGKKKGQEVDKGWACDLTPKELVVARFFAAEEAELESLREELNIKLAEREALEAEDNEAENTLLPLKEGKDADEEATDTSESKRIVDKAAVKRLIKEYKHNRKHYAEELAILEGWLGLQERIDSLKKDIKTRDKALDAAVYARIPTLTEEEVKTLVIDDKWLAQLESALASVLDSVGQRLTGRVKELAERYATPMPELDKRVEELETKVQAHLQRMGFSW